MLLIRWFVSDVHWSDLILLLPQNHERHGGNYIFMPKGHRIQIQHTKRRYTNRGSHITYSWIIIKQSLHTAFSSIIKFFFLMSSFISCCIVSVEGCQKIRSWSKLHLPTTTEQLPFGWLWLNCTVLLKQLAYNSGRGVRWKLIGNWHNAKNIATALVYN